MRRADVVVVGGGLSGMAAAHEVTKLGRSVIVLEAQDRVGGRTDTTPLDSGFYVEHGGVFLIAKDRENELVGLAGDVGVEVIDRHIEGNNVYLRKGRRELYDRFGPTGRTPPVVTALPELLLLNTRLDAMAQEVQSRAPWTAAAAEDWDSQTFDTFKLGATTQDDSRWVVDTFVETLTGVEPREFSLLYMTALLAGTKMSVRDLLEGFATARFVGGAQRISVRIGEQLGGRLVLRSPARRIEQDSRSVRVYSDRATVVAKRAILAIPPFLTGRIHYSPALPAQRAQLAQRMPHGSVFRINMVYDTPFWRDEGLTGEAYTDVEPLRLTLDLSPPDRSQGILTAFINGSAGRRWVQKSFEERKRGMLEVAAALYGPRAGTPRQYFEKAWVSEEWTAGCLYGVLPPGAITDYGVALREPVGRIHWAGTETATEWAASMEGAVRAGYAAARSAIASL